MGQEYPGSLQHWRSVPRHCAGGEVACLWRCVRSREDWPCRKRVIADALRSSELETGPGREALKAAEAIALDLARRGTTMRSSRGNGVQH